MRILTAALGVRCCSLQPGQEPADRPKEARSLSERGSPSGCRLWAVWQCLSLGPLRAGARESFRSAAWLLRSPRPPPLLLRPSRSLQPPPRLRGPRCRHPKGLSRLLLALAFRHGPSLCERLPVRMARVSRVPQSRCEDIDCRLTNTGTLVPRSKPVRLICTCRGHPPPPSIARSSATSGVNMLF